jgi:signal transduction histidine kinase
VTVRRRLTTSTALIALAAVLVLGIPLGIVEASRIRADETGRLEREADGVAGVVDDRLERGIAVSEAELRPLVRGGNRITVTTRGRTVSAGTAIRGRVLTVRSGVPTGAVITASAPRSEVDDRILRSWLLIAALGLGGIAVATGLAAVQARRLSRPLERVARASARLGEGDFSVRAPRSGVPEIDAIGRALDDSAGRIADLVAREREFSANVSHQLRTPLTALRLRLEESAHAEDPGALRDDLDAALKEADRLEAMIAALLAHARSSARRDMTPVPLGPAVSEHVDAWSALYARAGRRIVLRDVHDVEALAAPGTIGQILDVLLDNALRHGAGTVTVTVADDARRATIAVQDEGAGVPADAVERVFDRGASRSDSTGIGLHLARTLARADGGSLRLTSASPPRFELRLRRAAPGDDDGA